VEVVEKKPPLTIAGIRLSGKKSERLGRENRRKATRWQCSAQFYPVATCANPVEFNDFIYLRLKDVSATGFRAITSLRNKFLVPGMELSLQVSFPMVGYCNLTGAIARANLTAEDGKDYLELGIEFRTLGRRDQELIGQYLIQFGDGTSLTTLREEGLYLKSLVAGLDYTFVKTENEFMETLQLRHSANLVAGKIPTGFAAREMSDMYDARSRIINWSHRDQCVGTVRITFCERNEALELEDYMAIPSHFPRRDQIAEIGRAATHPDYRKSDLFYNLLQRVALLCLQAKRPFVIISTTEELLPMYQRVGLIDSKITYQHNLYPEKLQHVLHADVTRILAGDNVGVVAWNMLWKEVATHAVENGVLDAKVISTSKNKAFRLLSPFIAIPKFFMRRPRKQRARS